MIATTAASVTTARLTPRTRSADAAVIRPRITATSVPARGARGKPIPAFTARCEIVNPETPASVNCTTEIWPTNPVMTTSESAMTVPISVLISASRKSNGSTTSAIAQIATPTAVVRTRCCGRGASGSRFSTSSPRPGSFAPRRYMNSTIRMKITSSATPGIAVPPEVGNHERFEMYWISDSMIPRPIPAAHAIPNEVNRASSAAASAGTIWSGSVSVSSWVIDAARIPMPPAIADASSVFTIDSALGERPPSIAATSFSEAARVRSPKRVNW